MAEKIQANWNNQKLSSALGVEVQENFSASSISIDSRNIEKGAIFVALRGENFDGNKFVEKALESGAVFAICSDIEVFKKFPKKTFLVEDGLRALWKMAKFQRKTTKAKIISLTGSVGKTTIKSLLKACLSLKYKTYANPGNLNNHIGLPLSICNMPEDTEYGIFEMGMNHAGEISDLVRIAHPNAALISWISEAHIENFDSLEGIANAKAEIFEWLTRNSYAIIPADSEFYELLEEKAEENAITEIYSFGVGASSLISKNNNLSANILGQRVEFTNSLAEKFTINNVLLVLLASAIEGVNLNGAVNILEEHKAEKGRGELVELNNGAKLIDDSYNASPTSMKKSLNNFINSNAKHKIAIIGEMLELGKKSREYHLELEEYLKEIDLVYLVGKGAKPLSNIENVLFFDEADTVFDELIGKINSDSLILAKGSHGSNVWKIVEQIKNNC